MKRASIALRRIIPLLGLALAAPSMADVTPSSGGAGHVPEFTLEQIVGTHAVGQFVLSPDRSAVVFTHVGRYFGHPLLPAYGEDSNLFLLRLASGEQVKLTAGSATKSYPVFSPDGRALAYESEGDIWSLDLASGKTRRLTTDWGLDRSAAWSPDGKEIAFVSNRWGRSNIYVMSADGEREALRMVTPDRIGGANPAWSADGKTLIFAAALDEHFYSRGLYSISAAGGAQPKRITPEDNARNSWPTFYANGSRIAYFSDRSGYLNVWTMKPDGSDQQQLTREEQDQDYPENDYIQSIGLRFSPDGKRLLYFTNRLGNLDLKTVDLATGAAKFVENKDGSHHPVGWIDDRTVAFVYENYRTPPELYVKPLSGTPKRLTYTSHAAFGPDNFERLESVTWNSADGVSVHGYLRRPSWAKSGERLPALVLSHTYNVGQFYNQWSPIFNYIVQSGYVVLQVNHRGSNGYGTKFRDLPKGNWGFEQLKDIESAAGYLRALPDVDAGRVGMLGYSMGGYMTQLAVTNRPTLFKAAVAVFGLGEIVGDPQRSSQNYVWHLGGTETEKLDRYRNASPVTRVKDMQTPLMIVHSDGDPIEPVTKIRNFVYELDKYNKRYELALYSNEAHGLKLPEHQLDSYQRIMAFLDRYLTSQ
jgi:dipeptidyl aminopeptidase/acylaminoacyl peptidase